MRDDRCQDVVSSVTLTLSDGSWFGHLVLPKSATAGPACAVASSGTEAFDEGEGREAHIPITLLHPEDTGAARITLGNLGDQSFTARQTMDLFGLVVNPPDRCLRVVLTQDVGPARLLAEDSIRADAFGFWEVALPIPDHWTGFALLTISMGNGDDYTELRTVMRHCTLIPEYRSRCPGRANHFSSTTM